MVIAGVVRAVETALIAITGLALYFVYIVRNVGAQPGYFAVTIGVAALSIVVFQSLHVYTVPALRHPVARICSASPAAGRWRFSSSSQRCSSSSSTARCRGSGWRLVRVGFGALALERTILARVVAALVRAGRLEQRAVIVGGGAIGARLAARPRQERRSRSAIARRLRRPQRRALARTVEGYPKLGNVDDLVEFARSTRVDLVIFALPITAEQRILEMLRKLWVLPIDIRLAAHANRLRFRPRSYSYVG